MKKKLLITLVTTVILVQLTIALSAEMADFNKTDYFTSQELNTLDFEKSPLDYEYYLLTRNDFITQQEIDNIIHDAMREADNNYDGDGPRIFKFHFEREDVDNAFMGVVTRDLKLSEVRDMQYNKFYGVLITRVVPNSPARYFRLMVNDIIMEIDGTQIRDRSHFNNVIDTYFVGDNVQMKLFRDGREMTIDFTFGSRKVDIFDPESTPVKAVKTAISLEDLAGGWIPVWFTPEVDDINDLISRFGFSEINSDGLFLNGGGGHINVGKNIFIGGMGAGYRIDRKINHVITDDDGEPLKNVIRRMEFGLGYGGVTIDKKMALTNRLHTSYGAMLGWGSYRLEVSQTDGGYSWDNLHNQLDNEYNNFIKMTRNFIFAQPKLTVSYQLTGWLALRAEAGYILGHSYHSGWNVEMCNDVFEVTGSPDTSFNGLTISFGPWFTL